MRTRRSIVRLVTGLALLAAVSATLPACGSLIGVRDDGPRAEEDASRPTLFEVRRGHTQAAPLVAAVVNGLGEEDASGNMIYSDAMGPPQPGDTWFQIGFMDELQPPRTGDLCTDYAAEIPGAQVGGYANGPMSVENAMPCW